MMNPIPFGTLCIRLDTYGFNSYPECHGVVLIAETPRQNVRFWESDLYDTHPDETEYMLCEIRQEIEEVFTHYDFDISKIENYDSRCIYDWEFEFTPGPL